MMQGNLNEISGADILQILSQGGHEGCFEVKNKDVIRNLFVSDDGNVLYVDSSVPKEKLGFCLTQMALVSKNNLTKLRALEQSSGSKTALVLLKKKLVKPRDMGTCLKNQFQTVFAGLLAMKKGLFYFHNKIKPPKNFLKIQISIQSLLLNSAVMRDQNTHLISQLGGKGAIYGPGNFQQDKVTLSPVEFKVLIAAEKSLTVSDFLKKVEYADVDILKALLHMKSAGLLNNLGQTEKKEKSYVPENEITKITQILVDIIGPMGNFIITEAIETISEDITHMQIQDRSVLLDLLMKELDPEDGKQFKARVKELYFNENIIF